MNSGLPKEAEAVLAWWWTRAEPILAGRARSVMLFGSVTHGDFRPAWSDIDAAVFLAAPLDRSQSDALAALHDELARRFVEGGAGGWRNSQLLEVSYLLDSQELGAFARLQLAETGMVYAGEAVNVARPGREELAADSIWLLDSLDRAPGDFSAIMLCGLIQEVARKTVFWRDGELVSKTVALQREIAAGSPFRDAYRLALELRNKGSARCVDRLDQMKDQVARLAGPAHAELAVLLRG